MFVLQVGFMSPSIIGIVPSIEMVIFTAVGGRLSVMGAIIGCLIVNWGKTAFSEAYPDAWLYLMGGTFISVVMFFPNGIAGLAEKFPRIRSLIPASVTERIKGMATKKTTKTVSDGQ